MADLTWGAITICDTTTGVTVGGVTHRDNYFVLANNPADQDALDVTFPNTTGRMLKKFGEKQSRASSTVITIGGAGRYRAIIYDTSAANLQALITSIATARAASATAIATLTCYAGTFTNMRCDSITFGEPRLIQTGLWSMGFSAEFSEYGSG